MTDNEPKVLAILNDCAASNFEQAAAGPQLGHVGVAQPHAAAREQHTVPANMADQQDAATGAADLADPDDASSCEDLDDFLQPQTGHQEPGMTQTWDQVSTLLYPEALWWRLEAASRPQPCTPALPQCLTNSSTAAVAAGKHARPPPGLGGGPAERAHAASNGFRAWAGP